MAGKYKNDEGKQAGASRSYRSNSVRFVSQRLGTSKQQYLVVIAAILLASDASFVPDLS